MGSKEEFVKIVENQTKKLMDKYKLSESIHEDFYFSHGITVGMESLKKYLDKYYDMCEKSDANSGESKTKKLEKSYNNKNSKGNNVDESA